MHALAHEQYLALTYNSAFKNNHTPHFLKDLGNVYRNNRHLSPFLYDIKAFADNPEAPEIILIQKGTNISISANAECDTYDKALREFIAACLNEHNKSLWLHVSTEGMKNKANALFSHCNPTPMNRYNFRLNKDSFNKLPDWKCQLPIGFTVEYFDTKSIDFRKKHNKADDAFFPESKRFAFVALYDDKIISECFSVLVDENMVEIGVHTYDESFCRKGLAFATASAFTEHCVRQNLELNWGCDYHNSASIALAKKLGYELFSEDIGILLTIDDSQLGNGG